MLKHRFQGSKHAHSVTSGVQVGHCCASVFCQFVLQAGLTDTQAAASAALTASSHGAARRSSSSDQQAEGPVTVAAPVTVTPIFMPEAHVREVPEAISTSKFMRAILAPIASHSLGLTPSAPQRLSQSLALGGCAFPRSAALAGLCTGSAATTGVNLHRLVHRHLHQLVHLESSQSKAAAAAQSRPVDYPGGDSDGDGGGDSSLRSSSQPSDMHPSRDTSQAPAPPAAERREVSGVTLRPKSTL